MANNWDQATRSRYRDEVASLAGHNDVDEGPDAEEKETPSWAQGLSEHDQRFANRPVPEINATTVLCEEQEREIAFRSEFVGHSQRLLAQDFDVSQSTVSRVVATYRDVNNGALELYIIDRFDDEWQ
jgi:DNA-directed RNA polymerase specialized sigma24 family protein